MNKGAEIIPTIPGTYIAFHWKSTGNKAAVTAEEWPVLEAEGEEADGVLLIVEGREPIVISLSENLVYWGDSEDLTRPVPEGETSITVQTDYDGRNHIAKIIASNKSASYAPGWSYNFSSFGIPKNKWWLPSGGELKDIYNNIDNCNICFKVISGTTLLSKNKYWTSCVLTNNNVFILDFNNGNFSYVNKYNTKYRARAVSAFE